MAEPTDLFGNALGPDQLSLFGDAEDRMPVPVRSYTPDPEVIRKRLHVLLNTARSAAVMPWPEQKARMWQTVFPNMANWLPEEEANQLRFEFAREIERLKAA
jgi:hypothetical protein